MSKRTTTITVPLGLGQRIKSAREARGWTQPELGRAVGVSKSAVSQWEKGVVQNLKLGNLFAVSQALGRDVRELVFGEAQAHLSARAVAEQGTVRYADVSPQQLAMLRQWNDLPKDVRRHVKGLIAALAAGTARRGT
jgi:transcriptional regulator with XRE-family HTH domain